MSKPDGCQAKTIASKGHTYLERDFTPFKQRRYVHGQGKYIEALSLFLGCKDGFIEKDGLYLAPN